MHIHLLFFIIRLHLQTYMDGGNDLPPIFVNMLVSYTWSLPKLSCKIFCQSNVWLSKEIMTKRYQGQSKFVTITILLCSRQEPKTSITVGGTHKVKFMRLKPFSGFMAYLYLCKLTQRNKNHTANSNLLSTNIIVDVGTLILAERDLILLSM